MNFHALLVAAALMPLFTGCLATNRLWKTDGNGNVTSRIPAGNPAVEVFEDAQRGDFVIVYSSLLNRGKEAPERNAFYLKQNEAALRVHGRPELSSVPKNLNRVPVNGATNVFPYATFDRFLTIRTPSEAVGPIQLPMYPETKKGTFGRVVTTPIAVTADLTVFGIAVAGTAFGAPRFWRIYEAPR